MNLLLGTILMCTSPWIGLGLYGKIKIRDTKVKIVDTPYKNNDYYGIEFTVKLKALHGMMDGGLSGALHKIHNTEHYRPVNKEWLLNNCKEYNDENK